MAAKTQTQTPPSGNGDVQEQVYEEILLHKPPPLRLRQGRIPIGHVKFDPENPRLKYQKQLFPDKSDQDLLFDNKDTAWLLKDIKEKGVMDPIYVIPLPDDAEGRKWWKVTEGNRRTAVVKLLHEKNPDNAAFSYIPARIMPTETTPEQEALLMASAHVAGKIKWEPHEKAGHIWTMIYSLRLPESELSTTLHMGIPAIKKAAQSYDMLQHFKRIDGGKYADAAEGKWSYFSELFKSKELAEKYRNEGQTFADEFCRWVGEGRIPKAEDVRDLADILRKTRSASPFRDEPADVAFEKARKELAKASPGRDSKFFKDLERVALSGKLSTLVDQETVKTNDAARDAAIDAYVVIGQFLESAGVRVPGTPRRPS
jgi:hypothetical protein